jgi:hypothetical protein
LEKRKSLESYHRNSTFAMLNEFFKRSLLLSDELHLVKDKECPKPLLAPTCIDDGDHMHTITDDYLSSVQKGGTAN